MKVEIWSDVVCPWCAIGKRRFERALSQFDHADEVEVVLRSFELDPEAPRSRDTDLVGHLAAKYGMSREQAEASQARLTEMAEIEGLEFHFDQAQPGNTFDAHRVVHLAAEQGRQDEMKERFLRGYLCEGEAIGEPEVLVRLATEIGLDEEQVRATLSSDSFSRQVRADEAQAREIGIQGVPFFVLGGRFAVSGAQPVELLLRALQQTQQELANKPEELVEGAACGPDGC